MKTLAFSIIEMLIVLAIIAVLACMTVPQFFSLKKQALTNDIDQLFTVCAYLQQKAISRHTFFYLSFDEENNSYTYPGINNKQTTISLSNNICYGFIPKVKGPPGDPTKPITSAITFDAKSSTHSITFFSDGKISPGTVYFVDSKKKLMGALTCGLAHMSYMRKYFYTQKKWIVT